jgi:hypothetical protein
MNLDNYNIGQLCAIADVLKFIRPVVAIGSLKSLCDNVDQRLAEEMGAMAEDLAEDRHAA